ncbi:hypothetical protein SSX86_016427 [Deinandra increscens subsp. villosa]|uniref:Uncharacterized protein n=1 Tax=Deinandra increscens subsp. villosa TaxID=3103831 RepID=A0AAP0CY25_9ASTR
MMEDVLQQHDDRHKELDLDSRRYEAAAWMRKMIGVFGEKYLPAQPSEEEFKLALRSGTTLYYVINKVIEYAIRINGAMELAIMEKSLDMYHLVMNSMLVTVENEVQSSSSEHGQEFVVNMVRVFASYFSINPVHKSIKRGSKPYFIFCLYSMLMLPRCYGLKIFFFLDVVYQGAKKDSSPLLCL